MAPTLQRQATNEGNRFKELQDILKDGMAQNILQKIDNFALQTKVLTLIVRTLKKGGSLFFEDKLIIENALSLWVGCLLHEKNLIGEFFRMDIDGVNCEQFVLEGLLYCSDSKVKEDFRQNLSQLAHKFVEPVEGISKTGLEFQLTLLSKNFSLISKYDSKHYFELFCDIVDYYFRKKDELAKGAEEVFNPVELLSNIIERIRSLIQRGTKMEEEEENQGEIENIFVGLIQLTNKIIENFDIALCERVVEQKNLINEIFVNFLFASVFHESELVSQKMAVFKPSTSSGQGSAFGKKSRDAAYKLLNSLNRRSQSLMESFFANQMLPLMNCIHRKSEWNYQPPSEQKQGGQGFVGLVNLGCICYMNSMNQQFFNIPSFRYSLLSVDDGVEEDFKEYKKLYIDDNVLH